MVWQLLRNRSWVRPYQHILWILQVVDHIVKSWLLVGLVLAENLSGLFYSEDFVECCLMFSIVIVWFHRLPFSALWLLFETLEIESVIVNIVIHWCVIQFIDYSILSIQASVHSAGRELPSISTSVAFFFFTSRNSVSFFMAFISPTFFYVADSDSGYQAYRMQRQVSCLHLNGCINVWLSLVSFSSWFAWSHSASFSTNLPTKASLTTAISNPNRAGETRISYQK